MKTTVSTVQKMKDNGEKITMLTAYDYSTANYLTKLELTRCWLEILLEWLCLDMIQRFL